MENVIIIVGIVFFFEKEAETLGLCIEVIHASCNCLFTLGRELTFVSWCYLVRLEPLTLSLEEPFMMGFFLLQNLQVQTSFKPMLEFIRI
jgi:hypothetical protein